MPGEGDIKSIKNRLLFDLNFALLQDQIGAGNPLPDIMHVFNDCLEMGRGVVRFSYEDVIVLTSRSRRI